MRLLQEYENDYRAGLLDGFINSPFKGGDRLSKVGFIKDWRQELESDIWLMPPMYHRVWQWIKYSVNHSTGKIPNKDGTFDEEALYDYANELEVIGNIYENPELLNNED
jgi:hypothetical protein